MRHSTPPPPSSAPPKKNPTIFNVFDTNVQTLLDILRIDNSGWSVNSSALFDVAGMRWYQRKYHVLYTIRQPIINSTVL